MRYAGFLTVLALLGPLACDRGTPAVPQTGGAGRANPLTTQPAGAAVSQPAAAMDDAESDRILSLPYAGAAEVRPGEEHLSGVVVHERARCEPGYTLYSLLYQTGGADLVDADGNVVRKWRRPACQTWMHAELLPDGDLLAVGTEFPGGRRLPRVDDMRYVYRFDWNGALRWQTQLAAHHDIEVTPDGRLLTIVNKRRRIEAVHPHQDVVDDELTLLSPEGQVLESVSLYDAVAARPDLFPFRWRRLDSNELFHTNSAEWMRHTALFGTNPLYDPRHVLVSVRNESRIAILHWDRRELVWAWGGRNQIDGQHDATLLESGHILIFDNGVRQKRSRVIELDPVGNRVVWEYVAPVPPDFYSRSRGGAQRLANGNTLVANSDSGELFELTPDGAVVWRYLAPYKADFGARRVTLNRAHRHPPSMIAPLLSGPASQPASAP